MPFDEAFRYVAQSERRKCVLSCLTQPLTVKQLSSLASLKLPACCHVLSELRTYKVVRCLNQSARRSRLYWLTKLGQRCRNASNEPAGGNSNPANLPDIDWNLYGAVCFSHRSAVLRAISGPMQSVTIKRAARFQDPTIRMSANNVRDVIKFFMAEGIVTRIDVRGKHHPRYELTELGKTFQLLLLRAEGTR